MRPTTGYCEHFENGIKNVSYYFIYLQHENREFGI